MKKIIPILLLALCSASFAQKPQDPDTLLWNGRRYAAIVEPYNPSVLMAYYLQTAKSSPFTFWSSNNNRGHIATFEILNNALYLRSIEAKRYRTRLGNLWTESGIDTIVSPDFFDISPFDSSASFSPDMILTDWFTGFLCLKLLPKDKKDAKSSEANGLRFLFLEKGRISENTFISSLELSKLEKDPSDSRMQTQRSLLQRYHALVDFYARCSMDREEVLFNGHSGLFEHKPNSLTLAMLFHNNDPFSYYANSTDGRIIDAAPFGKWLIRGDSLFLSQLSSHSGKDIFSYSSNLLDISRFLADSISEGLSASNRNSAPDGAFFADWVSGDFVIHYGSWDKLAMDVPVYTVAKTQTLRIVNGVVTSSLFSPSSFDDDLESAAASAFNPCNSAAVFSVDDKQLAEVVGNFKSPKKNPEYVGGKSDFRNWFLKNPLTDERAKDRLFRVRLAFMVNCKGEVGQWQVISKGKGELFEFANIVLELVKTMPHNWSPATDRKGNPVDCWQIMEFTVSNGVLTNGNYR